MTLRMEMYLDLSYSLVRACADTMMFFGCSSRLMTSKTAAPISVSERLVATSEGRCRLYYCSTLYHIYRGLIMARCESRLCCDLIRRELQRNGTCGQRRTAIDIGDVTGGCCSTRCVSMDAATCCFAHSAHDCSVPFSLHRQGRVASHEEVTSRGGDQRSHQANQIIVHVPCTQACQLCRCNMDFTPLVQPSASNDASDNHSQN